MQNSNMIRRTDPVVNGAVWVAIAVAALLGPGGWIVTGWQEAKGAETLLGRVELMAGPVLFALICGVFLIYASRAVEAIMPAFSSSLREWPRAIVASVLLLGGIGFNAYSERMTVGEIFEARVTPAQVENAASLDRKLEAIDTKLAQFCMMLTSPDCIRKAQQGLVDAGAWSGRVSGVITPETQGSFDAAYSAYKLSLREQRSDVLDQIDANDEAAGTAAFNKQLLNAAIALLAMFVMFGRWAGSRLVPSEPEAIQVADQADASDVLPALPSKTLESGYVWQWTKRNRNQSNLLPGYWRQVMISDLTTTEGSEYRNGDGSVFQLAA